MEETQLLDFTQDYFDNSDDDSQSETNLVGWLEIFNEERKPIRIGTTKIGRDPSTCSIVLHDKKTISKEHAVIEAEDQCVTIMDLGSRNRTRLNKLYLKPNVRYGLTGGETIRFGDVLCTFQFNSEIQVCDDSDSILQDAGPLHSRSKTVKDSDVSTDASLFISPTPQVSTSIFPSTCHRKSVTNLSLTVPETPCPATQPGTSSSIPKMGSRAFIIQESPSGTQSTPINDCHKMATKNIPSISPIDIKHIKPSINDAGSFTVNSSITEQPSDIPPSKLDYGSDESTDIEDLFEKKDNSSLRGNNSQSLTLNLTEDDAPTQIFQAENSHQKKSNPDGSKNEDDISSMETQKLPDKIESTASNDDLYDMPTQIFKLPDEETKAPDSDDEDIFNMPTQKFVMNETKDKDEDIFAMPTQVFQPPDKSKLKNKGNLNETDDATSCSPNEESSRCEGDIFDMPTQCFSMPESPTKVNTETSKEWTEDTQDVLSVFKQSKDDTQEIINAFDHVEGPNATTPSATRKDNSVTQSKDLCNQGNEDNIYEAETQVCDESLPATQYFDPSAYLKAKDDNVKKDLNETVFDDEPTQIFDSLEYEKTKELLHKNKEITGGVSSNIYSPPKAGFRENENEEVNSNLGKDENLYDECGRINTSKNSLIKDKCVISKKDSDTLNNDSDTDSNASETLLLNVVNENDGLEKSSDIANASEEKEGPSLLKNGSVNMAGTISAVPTISSPVSGFNSDESTDIEENKDDSTDFEDDNMESPIHAHYESYDIMKDCRLISSDEDEEIIKKDCVSGPVKFSPAKNSTIPLQSDQVAADSEIRSQIILDLSSLEDDYQDSQMITAADPVVPSEKSSSDPVDKTENPGSLSPVFSKSIERGSSIKKASRSLMDTFNESLEKIQNESLTVNNFTENVSKGNDSISKSVVSPRDDGNKKNPEVEEKEFSSNPSIDKRIDQVQSENSDVHKSNTVEDKPDSSNGNKQKTSTKSCTNARFTSTPKVSNLIRETKLSEPENLSPIIENEVKRTAKTKQRKITPNNSPRKSQRHSKRLGPQVSTEDLHAIQEEDSLSSTKNLEIEIHTPPKVTQIDLGELFSSPRTDEVNFSGFDDFPRKSEMQTNQREKLNNQEGNGTSNESLLLTKSKQVIPLQSKTDFPITKILKVSLKSESLSTNKDCLDSVGPITVSTRRSSRKNVLKPEKLRSQNSPNARKSRVKISMKNKKENVPTPSIPQTGEDILQKDVQPTKEKNNNDDDDDHILNVRCSKVSSQSPVKHQEEIETASSDKVLKKKSLLQKKDVHDAPMGVSKVTRKSTLASKGEILQLNDKNVTQNLPQEKSDLTREILDHESSPSKFSPVSKTKKVDNLSQADSSVLNRPKRGIKHKFIGLPTPQSKRKKSNESPISDSSSCDKLEIRDSTSNISDNPSLISNVQKRTKPVRGRHSKMQANKASPVQDTCTNISEKSPMDENKSKVELAPIFKRASRRTCVTTRSQDLSVKDVEIVPGSPAKKSVRSSLPSRHSKRASTDTPSTFDSCKSSLLKLHDHISKVLEEPCFPPKRVKTRAPLKRPSRATDADTSLNQDLSPTNSQANTKESEKQQPNKPVKKQMESSTRRGRPSKRASRMRTGSSSSFESCASLRQDSPTSSSARSTRSSRKGHSPHLANETILFSPSQRQEYANTKPRVLFTSYTDKKDEKVVKETGGRVVESAVECSVLVAVGIRRTCKLLAAIARGVPLVSPAWIAACKQAKSFVDPMQYLIVDKEAEKKFGFSLKRSLMEASKHRLLTGYSIHATVNVKPPSDQLREIIECAGGEYLEIAPKIYTPSIVVVSCQEDKSLWNKFNKLKLPIVSAEFILTGLLRQKIMIKENLLTS